MHFLKKSEQIAPFVLQKKSVAAAPMMISSPHSGTFYPDRLFQISSLTRRDFQKVEDAAVDSLFSFAPSLGIPLLSGTYGRIWVDLNRSPWELDQTMFSDSLPEKTQKDSVRVLAGLGVIPKIVMPGCPVYKEKLRFSVEKQRLKDVYYPYHLCLKEQIKKNIDRFGKNLLIDAHSMPELPAGKQLQGKTPDFILGDVNGASCAPEITHFAAQTLSEMGYFVTVNHIYCGAHTTRFYGRPQENSHVLQVEIARHLYWDAENYRKTPYFDTLWRHLSVFTEKMRKMMQS